MFNVNGFEIQKQDRSFLQLKHFSIAQHFSAAQPLDILRSTRKTYCIGSATQHFFTAQQTGLQSLLFIFQIL